MKREFNNSTIKISYCTTENTSAFIKRHNGKKLYDNNENDDLPCNCARVPCPLPNGILGKNCRSTNVVYKAEVKNLNNHSKKVYYGCTKQRLKQRIEVHRNTFRDPVKKNNTDLAKEVHAIKDNNETFEIAWSIVEKSRKFEPGDRFCKLCICEKQHILYNENNNLLNQFRLESCRHKKDAYLASLS